MEVTAHTFLELVHGRTVRSRDSHSEKKIDYLSHFEGYWWPGYRLFIRRPRYRRTHGPAICPTA